MADDVEQVEVKNRAALRRWLTRHHTQAESIWLVSYKKSSPHYLSYDAIVEEALCFGWIDSQPRLLDADRSMLRLSPRKAKSGWSGVNKQRIERLIAAGLMAAPGLAVIEAAKRSGTWSLLDAAHFVASLQRRQGTSIACLEEIAYRMKFISADQLDKLSQRFGKSQYGHYLRRVLEEGDEPI